MTRRFDVALAFLIYAIGLSAFLFLDLYVSAQLSEERVAEWAFYKSAIFILGGICLLGHDQVLVRDPRLISCLRRTFLHQALGISIVGGAIVGSLYGIDGPQLALLAALVLAYAVLMFLAGAARANNHLWQAQLATNAWKVVLLAPVVALPTSEVSIWYVIALAVGVVLSLFSKGYRPSDSPSLDGVEPDVSRARRLGFSFFLHNMTLVAAIYGEQFVINLSGNTEVSYLLFSYVAVFTPIALSVNGFVGFFLGPYIRRRPRFDSQTFGRLFMLVAAGAVLITALSMLAGVLIFRALHGAESIDVIVLACLAWMCVSRGVYTVPSACIGVFASQSILSRVALIHWVLLGGFCIGVGFAVTRFDGMTAVRFVALAGLLHWTARMFVATAYAHRSVREMQSI